MPLCTLHLLALDSNTTVRSFLDNVRATLPPDQHPLITSRPIRWIITPTKLSPETLLDPLHPNEPSPPAHNGTVWDLLIILPTSNPLPDKLLTKPHVRAQYTLSIGVPSRVLQDHAAKNAELLRPSDRSKIPALTGALDKPILTDSAQTLALTPELRDWARNTYVHTRPNNGGAVSMLNLLAFHPGPDAHASYQKYGEAFAKSIGSSRGGVAKIVGKVVPSEQKRGAKGEDERKAEWDEVALAHYPSVLHFCDMAASKDYQEFNEKYRVPALKDTCILMTSELDDEVVGEGPGGASMGGMVGAKL